MDMSSTEEAIRSQTIIEPRRHGDKVTTLGEVSTIHDLWREEDINPGTEPRSEHQRTL